MASGTITARIEAVTPSERADALGECLADLGALADQWYWAPWLRFEIETEHLPITELTACVAGVLS